MKTYYFQVDPKTNIITDAIEYPYADYVPYETDSRLPIGIYSGWFKLEDGVVVEYPDLKPVDKSSEMDARTELLQQSLSEVTMYMAEQEIKLVEQDAKILSQEEKITAQDQAISELSILLEGVTTNV